jgi:hypothetical protein
MAPALFGFFGSFTAFTIYFQLSNFFGLTIIEET